MTKCLKPRISMIGIGLVYTGQLTLADGFPLSSSKSNDYHWNHTRSCCEKQFQMAEVSINYKTNELVMVYC